MFRKAPLLLVALSLLTAACQQEKGKDEPQPALTPALTGHWVWQRAVVTRYDVNNQIISSAPQVAPPGNSYLEITDETLQRFQSDGTALTPPLNYVQDGSTIYYDRARSIITIRSLTPDALALHAEGEFTPGRGHTNTDTYYVR